MRGALAPAFCGLLALCACAPGPKPAPISPTLAGQNQPQNSADALLEQSSRTLLELRQASPHRMLDAAIEDARALIVLPGVYHAGFFYSVHGGSGVLVARRADGGWGAPVFVSVAGLGYGPQAGVEKVRLVLAVQEEEMLERILDSGLSFEASAKFDILGVREQTSRGSLTQGRPVEVFSDGVGLMAGVGIRGGTLQVNQSLTASYYGQAGVQEILRGTSAPGLGVFRLWSSLSVEAPGPEIIRAGP